MFKGVVHFIAPKNKSKWYNFKIIRNGEVVKKQPIWEQCFNSWEKSSFNIKLLNDKEDIDNIIKRYSSDDFVNVLNDVPVIYKVDIARYIILGSIGGGYADMDMFLNIDFRKALSSKKIYINSRGKNTQNSLMFSPKHDFWFDVLKESEKRVFNRLNEIKLNTKERINARGKNKAFKIKERSELLISETIGGTMLRDMLNLKKMWGEVIKFPEEYFNLSHENPFAFTIHFCTGLWRVPGRIYGSEEESFERLITK